MSPNALQISESSRPFSVTSERAMASLWQKADTLSEGLVTEDGRRFKVKYPGRANARAGPDFHDAIFATEEGEVITGDVELHLKAPDWYGHRHHTDPGYNGVVLHVVLQPKGRSASMQKSGMTVPVASIAHVAPFLECAEISPHDVLAQLKSLDQPALAHVLDRAGDERFLAKSRGFAMEMADANPEQVMYRALMEALGYSSNRAPFRDLAERVPITMLTRLKSEPACTRLMAIKAQLVGASGLLPYLKPSDKALELKRLLKHLPRVRAMPAGRWQLFRVRPSNHPIARITGAVHLIERYIETGLVRGLEEEISSGDAGSLIKQITFPPYIGKGRASDILVNVALPLLHSYALLKRSPGLRERCVEAYNAFPKLADNEITREVMRLLKPKLDPIEIVGARRQQGLIHIYKSYTRPGFPRQRNEFRRDSASAMSRASRTL